MGESPYFIPRSRPFFFFLPLSYQLASGFTRMRRPLRRSRRPIFDPGRRPRQNSALGLFEKFRSFALRPLCRVLEQIRDDQRRNFLLDVPFVPL
jgi:hypothetical protein